MDYVSQKSLRAFILAYLFAAAQTDKAGRSIDEIKSIIVKTIGLRRVEIGIEELEGDELVEDISSTSAYEYALTAEGYIHAEKSYLNEKSQSFKKIADRVLDILNGEKSSAEPISISDEGSAIPAADRFVEVSHNSAGYVEAVDSVEGALEAVRQSNTLEPEERGWIQSNLQIGLDAFKKGGRLLVDGLKSFIFEPLKAALASVSEEKLKTAISIAIAAVRNFLGL